VLKGLRRNINILHAMARRLVDGGDGASQVRVVVIQRHGENAPNRTTPVLACDGDLEDGVAERWQGSPDGHTAAADGLSLDALVELAYAELRAVASRQLAARGRAAGGEATLETTALVHEAYLKLAGGAPGRWRDESHFKAVASVAMRHILVDRARSRAAERHGGALGRITFDDTIAARDDEPETLLAIDAACAKLAETSPRLARLVELRFFGGLTEEEVARELGVTVRTVRRYWIKARLLLAVVLAP
jgi:RNA polymerase sigma factor (TIGR02999 family)